MPEGHTIHRYARSHRGLPVGRTVSAWSPQGRFDAGAAALDGGCMRDVEATGEHLWYRFRTGGRTELTLHVHLGQVGRFRRYGADPRPPTAGTRLGLSTGDA
jgi:endonuclease-8